MCLRTKVGGGWDVDGSARPLVGVGLRLVGIVGPIGKVKTEN